MLTIAELHRTLVGSSSEWMAYKTKTQQCTATIVVGMEGVDYLSVVEETVGTAWHGLRLSRIGSLGVIPAERLRHPPSLLFDLSVFFFLLFCCWRSFLSMPISVYLSISEDLTGNNAA